MRNAALPDGVILHTVFPDLHPDPHPDGRTAAGEGGEQARSLLWISGLETEPDAAALATIEELLEAFERAGFARSATPELAQAYVRAVGRIAAVESALASEALYHLAPASRSATGARVVADLEAASARAFRLLHRRLLGDALAQAASRGGRVGAVAIGMADIVSSTAYFRQAGAEDLERTADAIFAAGQRACARRAVRALKYVGDGVLVAGPDVRAVAEATHEVVVRLQSELPVAARGGVAYGEVVHRAGDLYGLAVNLSLALAKTADPGSVLLGGEAVERVSPHERGRVRRRRLHCTTELCGATATFTPAQAQASPAHDGRSA